MSEIYTIRAILDAEEDVIRDVAIQADAHLYNLHQLLVEAFDLEKGEMSSFFKSNREWDQGEEISMMDFDPDTGLNPLEKLTIQEAFEQEGERMLFVYDYLNLWTFYLEALAIREAENGKKYPHVVAGIGERPNEAPHKEMTGNAHSEEDENYDLNEDEDENFDEDEDPDLWY